MKYLLLPLVLFSFFGCSQTASTDDSIQALEKKIEDRLNGLEGDFAVALQSLDTPETNILINADERFHAASTMKTPVIIEVYKQAQKGIFSVEDSIPVKNTFKSIVDGSEFTMQVSEDSEQDLYNQLGQKTSIYELSYQMITRSSNLATNILIDYLDAENVTQTMREIGADSIEVLRGVEDIKAYEAGLSNSTTARDLMIMFEQLVHGEMLSQESKSEIISVLKDQKYNDMFPVKLPAGTPVAHKTGWITGVHHDSGIIYTPEGEDFVLVFLSKNAPNREAVLDAAADIAKYSYDFMNARGVNE